MMKEIDYSAYPNRIILEQELLHGRSIPALPL